MDVRRVMVDFNHAYFSVRKQCGLLGLNRSGLYYDPVSENGYNLQLMRLLDRSSR